MKHKILVATLMILSLVAGGCSFRNTQNAGQLSEEEARQIALSHAGLTAEKVTFIQSNIDRDDGRDYFDIEFYTGTGKEYDYEIDLYTGEILNFDYESR